MERSTFLKKNNQFALKLITGVLLLALMLSRATFLPNVTAQDQATLEVQATAAPPVTITGLDPMVIVAGQSAVLSIAGTNFTGSSTIQVIGVGPFSITFVNSSLIRILLPASLQQGQYYVQVNDPIGGTALSSGPFSVVLPTPTPSATPLPPMTVSSSEPTIVSSGHSTILSVFGANIPSGSTIRLLGFGLLSTSFVSSSSLTGIIPDNIAPGQYTVEVIDPVGRTVQSPSSLLVIGPTPLPPTETQLPTQTIVPTIIPGQPSLFVRAFTVSPSTIEPGKTALVTFEVINQGNYEALGISISVDSGSKFLPANGQAGAAIASIPPGGSIEVSLRIVAAVDSTPGPTSIPLTLNYSASDGKMLSSKASLSVTIRKVNIAPQVLLVNYTVNPESVEAGKPVSVQVQLKNVGNELAPQVQLRLADSNSLLLPGPQGSRFSAGTLSAGAQTHITLPLMVPPDAKDGLQTQSLVISYTNGDNVEEIPINISIKIVRPITQEPLFVLADYSTNTEMLQPGDQFQLKLKLKNIGRANATNLVVTFGTVNSSSIPAATPVNQGGDNSVNYVPSGVFAPLKTSGTILVGNVPVDDEADLTQDFIVNAAIPSGIYGVPITLRYRMPDGSNQQNMLQASLVVVVPPKIQIVLQSPLPSIANVGESIIVSLKVANSGKSVANLSTIGIETENANVMDGAESSLGPLEIGNNVVVATTIIPIAEGNVVIKVTLHYMDDLNRDQTLVKTYEVPAVVPPPPATFAPSVENATVEDAAPKDVLQQLLFGLLGLGS